MRAVRASQHLNAAVAPVADDKVALGVESEVAPVAPKLAIAAASAAHTAQVRAVAESEHLHTRVVRIEHGKVARAVTSD